MKLGMSLSLGLSQRMEQKQEIKLKQAISLRQELRQQLTLQISNNRVDIGLSNLDMIKSVIEQITKTSDPDTASIFENIFLLDKAFETINQEVLPLIRGRKKDIQKFAYLYLFATQTDANGEFSIEPEEDSKPITKVKVFRADYIDAITNPEKLIKEKTVLLEVFKEKPDNIYPKRISEIQTALNIADQSKELGEFIELATNLLLQKNVNGENIFKSLLQDIYLLSIMNYQFSDRLLKRMASVFAERNFDDYYDREDVYINGVLNAIGEYTLLILGIITPELFASQRVVISEQARIDFNCTDDEIVNKIISRVDLENKRQIFLSRYKTANFRPNQITDDLIRNFITKTVRAQGQHIIEKIDFHYWFDQLKESYDDTEPSDLRNKEKRAVFFYDHCARLLLSEKLNNTLIDLIKNEWHKELAMFYVTPKTEESETKD